MSKTFAAITAVSAWAPEDVLSNADLEKLVDTNDEWITSRTGIKERRILKDPNLASSDLAVPAVKQLLEKRGIGADELDLIICASVTPDMFFPTTANIIADKVGATNAFCFDMNAACSGFLYAINMASKYIESGSHKKVLVVGADKMSSIVDYTDRRTCILFGDAAGVALLEPSDAPYGIMDSVMYSDGKGREYLRIRGGGSLNPASYDTVDAKYHYIEQEGRSVFKAAVKGMSSAIMEVMERNNLSADDVAWVVPHQANKRIIDTVADMANFPKERVTVNIDRYGNTTNATIPLCLTEWEGRFKKGDNIILTAFGAGFSWGAIYIKWGY